MVVVLSQVVVLSEVVVLSVVVLSVVVLSVLFEPPSLLLLQEMMVKLKMEIRKMNKTFFIFSSIPKVKYYGLVLGEPNLYHNLEDFTRKWGVLTWWVD